MKIYSLSIVQVPSSGASSLLTSASDLSSFSFYQKGSVGEFMQFFSKMVAERTAVGQRQSIQENNYIAHVYNRGGPEQLAGKEFVESRQCSKPCLVAVVITDQEYPVRPAFSLLAKILDEFTSNVPQELYDNPSSISFPEIDSYVRKYQDPEQADPIMRVQAELDETKIILVRLQVKSRLCQSLDD